MTNGITPRLSSGTRHGTSGTGLAAVPGRSRAIQKEEGSWWRNRTTQADDNDVTERPGNHSGRDGSRQDNRENHGMYSRVSNNPRQEREYHVNTSTMAVGTAKPQPHSGTGRPSQAPCPKPCTRHDTGRSRGPPTYNQRTHGPPTRP